MGDGGYRVRRTETRKGAASVRVDVAGLPCQRSEPDSEDALKDF